MKFESVVVFVILAIVICAMPVKKAKMCHKEMVCLVDRALSQQGGSVQVVP